MSEQGGKKKASHAFVLCFELGVGRVRLVRKGRIRAHKTQVRSVRLVRKGHSQSRARATQMRAQMRHIRLR